LIHQDAMQREQSDFPAVSEREESPGIEKGQVISHLPEYSDI